MTSLEQNKVTQMKHDKAQADVIAALMETYNPKVVELPVDPWVELQEGKDAASDAIEETYGN